MGTEHYIGLTKKVGTEIRWTGEVRLVESALDLPLRWKKPRRIFVNSMSDLFHESVKDEWIAAIFAVMFLAGQHTYQILTKRPERMRDWMQWLMRQPDQAGILLNALGDLGIDAGVKRAMPGPWPKPHVWLGVSVEDQATADERIQLLLQTPAVVRWISYEPALGPIDFSRYLPWGRHAEQAERGVRVSGGTKRGPRDSTGRHDMAPPETWGPLGVDQIIVGGESGPGARPFDLAWARQTIAQCRAAGVPVFIKQLGARPWWDGTGPTPAEHIYLSPGVELNGKVGWALECLRDRKGGSMEEWPSDLRVREYPA